MYSVSTKATRLNLRITTDLRGQIETLADHHGLSMSSYAHSLLVKAVRRAVDETPEAFTEREQNAYSRGVVVAPKGKAKMLAQLAKTDTQCRKTR